MAQELKVNKGGVWKCAVLGVPGSRNSGMSGWLVQIWMQEEVEKGLMLEVYEQIQMQEKMEELIPEVV